MDPASSRQRNSQWSTRIGVVALVLLVIYLGSQSLGGALLPEGTPAPTLALPIAHGGSGELALDDLRGHVVLLEFWSTTCPPCLKTMDEIEAIAPLLLEQEVRIVGIAVAGEQREDLAHFGRQRGTTYPLVVGDDATADAYRVRILPSLYILDREGKVAKTHTGYWSREGIASAIREVVSSSSPKN